MFLADGYDAAFVGVGRRFGEDLAIYDEEKCLGILMERDGMSLDEAREFFEFNTAGSWVGEGTPIFLRKMELDEVREYYGD